MNSEMVIVDNELGCNDRFLASSSDVSVMTQIYDEDINIAVWQRSLSQAVIAEVANILQRSKHLNLSVHVDARSISEDVTEALQMTAAGDALISNISELIDMFCTLFEQKQAGLRLRLLDKPMCPRFHIDRVPCRLVTTFTGQGSQWLAHDCVDRSKLGHGSNGLDDSVSGLYRSPADIKTVSTGSVALFKGETWFENENAGIVHRSPPYIEGEKRLLLTLDFLA